MRAGVWATVSAVKVGVDARHLRAGRGVAHYTRSMLAALAAAHPEDEWLCFVPGHHPVDAPTTPNVTLVRDRRPSRLIFGAAALTGRPRLDRLLGGDLDVLWIPAPAPVALSDGLPYVLTVHDLTWVDRPEDFTAYERLWHGLARMERLATGAAGLVCDSRATARAAEAHWQIDDVRLRVVSPGVTAGPPGPLPDGLPNRFLLFVGALEPRKGVDVLARAYKRARAAGLDAGLVVAGAGRLAGELDDLPDTVVLPACDRPTLDALYETALAVVAPSWLEGFGFVPLEAALHGTPAVLSNLDVFVETLGEHALHAPAGDDTALGEALLRVADDQALRQRLGEGARSRAAALTWAAAAAGLYDVLAGAATA